MKSLPLVKTLSAAFLLASLRLHAVPTEIAKDSFESVSGDIGFTTSVSQFELTTVTTSDFFSVLLNNGTKTIGGAITGGDGAKMFAAEDIDTFPANLSATQSVTFNSVNIAGKINTSVKILLAAPGTGPAAAGTQNFYDHAATLADIDLVRVEASVDGGPFNRLIQFSPTQDQSVSINSSLGLDSDGNGLADPATTNLLTAAFRNFDLPIPTGNAVQVRVVMHSNATSEYICMDHLRIFGESSATAAPAIIGVPGTALVFTEGAVATAIAPGLSVTDADSSNLASASVVISQNLVSAEDLLAATPSGAILASDIVYTAATGTLTITRSASLATYQAVLQSVTYKNNNATTPTTATRQIRFNVNDGTNPSNSPIRSVDVVDNINTQALPFTESFETDGRGIRYALDGRFTNGTALFDRGTPTGLTSLDGTSAIIAEDTLLDSTSPIKAVRFHLNTASYSNIKATIGLGVTSASVFDTNDYIIVEASADGGAYTPVGDFRSTAAINSPLALDTNNDGVGDGTQLDSTIRDFIFNLPTASSLVLRVRCQSNSSGERIIVDRVLVNGTPPPGVASVNSSTLNGSYKVGDVASIQVNFSAAVTVTGTPQLTLETGATDRVVNYASGSGTSTLTFTYTVQAGDVSSDLDYQSTTALALNGGTIKDTATNSATLTLPAPGATNSLGSNKALVIDGVVPTAASVNSSTTNGTYKIGDHLSIQVNFSEVVTVIGSPQLTVETGATDRVVNYASGSGTSALTFTYTVQAGDVSSDLDYQSTTALALNAGTIKDSAGNPATLTLPAPGATNSLGANKALVIDGIRPTAVIVVASSSLSLGQTSLVTITFSEAVTGFTNADLTLANGTLTAVTSSNGGVTWTATFTPTAAIIAATNAITLNNTGVMDTPGNAGSGTTNSNNYAIDTSTILIGADVASIAEGTGSGNTAFTFTVSRTGPTTTAATVNYAVSGAAVTAADFGGTLPSGNLNIPSGQSSAILTINVSKDNLVELDEAFTVTLTSPSNGTLGTATASETITNDDASVITFSGPTANEGDTGTSSFSYTINLSAPVDTTVSFSGATLGTGTATAGTDYTAVASTPISISSGGSSSSFSVSVIGDHLTEPDETLIAQLSSLAASGRNVSFSGAGTTLNGTATLQNDDPAIVPGPASLNLAKGISGKILRTALIASATGGEGPLTITAVQSTATAGGGTLSSSDGWIIYQPTATFTGVDSFSYTLNDGFNSVTGTVSISVSTTATGQTVNILGITTEGIGNRVIAMGIPGRIYQFQISTNLLAWTNFGSSTVCPANGILGILDPGPLPPTRFYRMSEAP